MFGVGPEGPDILVQTGLDWYCSIGCGGGLPSLVALEVDVFCVICQRGISVVLLLDGAFLWSLAFGSGAFGPAALYHMFFIMISDGSVDRIVSYHHAM